MPSEKPALLKSLLILLASFIVLGCVPDKAPNNTADKQEKNVKSPQTQATYNTLSNQNLTASLNSPTEVTNSVSATQPCNNQAIATAYQAHNPNQKTQVLGCGQIIKVLKDDTNGSQHQKFLVKIDGYPHITVLIAHNIDLAQRVTGITANQPIRFYGEYIYNPKGGVVHWTHKDPAARHQDGWLEYQGQKYQ